ncbi:HNH endonuclease [Streptomyces sp. H27-D2]|uniref:HNH endonuclease n=1 Tax=Streptomyces sp. H27-D2 TaxID=3046304 RepID=UPI002DBB1C7E|nr:HNH endonuclease [Streptomyces sp. H27-D2]MEC4016030.1 HNH endonuclease [Streptomyces sp. H27-D2]
MALLKIDSRASSHPKVMRAGNAALGLWMRLASWAVHQHPGDWTVPGQLVRSYSTATQLRRLVAAGLATPVGDDYELDSELLSSAQARYRTPIHPEQRQRLYERDGYRCLECGATDDLTLDHIYPWSRGGADTDDNLRTLCRPCNSRKGANI